MGYQNYFDYGQRVAVAWLQTGWPNDLKAVIEDSRATDPARRAAGDMALLGALLSILAGLRSAQENGVAKFTKPIPSDERLLYAKARGADDYVAMANGILKTAHDLRKACPGMRITFGQHSDQMEKKTEEPAKREPLEVKIVAMPERETTTTVERDGRDNIKQTVQVEKDSRTADQ